MTPNIASILEWVRGAYPDLPPFQVTNCRKIAGSNTWSQHSWSNAADIFVDKPTGDRLAAELRGIYGEWIKALLWQVKDHYDHIHIDTWPTGYQTPPCGGGTLKVRHKNGTVGSAFTDDIPDPIPEPGVDRMLPLDPTSAVEDIRSVQNRLNLAYNTGLTLDGVWGVSTTSAVKTFLGSLTGDPVAKEGNRIVARQWDQLLIDMVKKQSPGGPHTHEATVFLQ